MSAAGSRRGPELTLGHRPEHVLPGVLRLHHTPGAQDGERAAKGGGKFEWVEPCEVAALLTSSADCHGALALKPQADAALGQTGTGGRPVQGSTQHATHSCVASLATNPVLPISHAAPYLLANPPIVIASWQAVPSDTKLDPSSRALPGRTGASRASAAISQAPKSACEPHLGSRGAGHGLCPGRAGVAVAAAAY